MSIRPELVKALVFVPSNSELWRDLLQATQNKSLVTLGDSLFEILAKSGTTLTKFQYCSLQRAGVGIAQSKNSNS